MMTSKAHADDRIGQSADGEDAAASATAFLPAGRVVSVGGSQVIVEFGATDGESATAAATVGMFFGIWNGHSLVVGALCDMALHRHPDGHTLEPATGRIDLLGELVLDQPGAGYFRRGVMTYPAIGSAIIPLGHDALTVIFDNLGPNSVTVGSLQQDQSIAASVEVDDLISKHFAIFGSTGAGKSSAVAVLLREIMQARPGLRMLLIDPHNEYAHCFDDRAHVVRPGTLHLPYWLFSFDEIVEVIFGRRTDVGDEVALLAELIPLAKNDYARAGSARPGHYRTIEPAGGRFTVDMPVPYRIDDLVSICESRMGKLENNAIAGHYRRLLTRIHTVRKNPRYAFIFDEPADAGDSMVDILCNLLRLQDDGRPITVVQLAGFPAEVFDAIVAVLFRLAFDFGLWSDGALPLLIVCEEAHNYANVDRAIGFQPAREAVSRIAKEGRKYGVFLGVVTQRPALLDPTLVSQCSTVFAMRMANEDDQRIVQAAVSDPANRLLGFLASLGAREAIAFGAGVPVATRLRFKELPAEVIPRSEAVWGGRIDGCASIERGMVAHIVARWRGQVHGNRPVADGNARPAAFDTQTFDSPLSWTTPGLE